MIAIYTYINYWRVSFIWIAFVLALGILRLQAQVDSDGSVSIQEDFDSAVGAMSGRYFELRKGVVVRPEAPAFLKGMSRSDNLKTRVVALGMLEWCINAERNEERMDSLEQRAKDALRSRAHPVYSIVHRAIGGEGLPFDKGLGLQDVLREVGARSFLLEVALKGGGKTSAENASGNHLHYGQPLPVWIRAYAVALLGEWGDDTDSVLLLGDLCASGDSDAIRACAAAGLWRSGSPMAVEPLIDAMGSSDPKVRNYASAGLKKILGIDFGQDAKKYREWWEKSKGKKLLPEVGK